MFCTRKLRKKMGADLDRLETMCTGLSGLLPEDNERATILQKILSKHRIKIRVDLLRL
jgi:hypothetical protein